MTADPYAAANEIIELVKTIPNIYFCEDGVPDKDSIPMDAMGRIKPHVVMSFAGLTEPSKRVNGITGAQDDTFLQGFSVHSIAGDVDAAKQVNSLVWKKVLGFIPTGCGEIRPAFFAGIGQSSSLSQPTRYSAVQSYKFLINA